MLKNNPFFIMYIKIWNQERVFVSILITSNQSNTMSVFTINFLVNKFFQSKKRLLVSKISPVEVKIELLTSVYIDSKKIQKFNGINFFSTW